MRGTRSLRARALTPWLMLGIAACLPLAAHAQNPQKEAREWEKLLDAERGVTLGLVSAGVLSPAEAEAAGALPLSETVRLIDNGGLRGFLSPSERGRVRLELGELLGRQLSETPRAQWPAMATSVKLAVADVYRSQSDARAVPLY